MILLWIGCVDALYPGRTWSCEDWASVGVDAPGPLLLLDAGPDERCRVAAEGETFPRPDGETFVDADDVVVTGTTSLRGSWAPGDGTTYIELTDRDEGGDLLDLVEVRAASGDSGAFTWDRGGGSVEERVLSVDCVRCNVRARQVGTVTLAQRDAASVAYVCDVDVLVLGEAQGVVVTHQVGEVVGAAPGRVDVAERPDACSR